MNTTSEVDYFELVGLPEEEQEAFLDQVGELVMKAVLRKAWIELDSEKRDTLTKLIEESDADPENEKKSDAVLVFLDEHVARVAEYAKTEMETLLTAYREARDAVEDELT